jgi:hypothetical protein
VRERNATKAPGEPPDEEFAESDLTKLVTPGYLRVFMC